MLLDLRSLFEPANVGAATAPVAQASGTGHVVAPQAQAAEAARGGGGGRSRLDWIVRQRQREDALRLAEMMCAMFGINPAWADDVLMEAEIIMRAHPAMSLEQALEEAALMYSMMLAA
jgi:hypothetical protein